MEVKFFDFEDVDVHILTPVPVSILEGLVMEGTFLEAEREATEATVSVGIGGEVLVSDICNPVHVLKLTYLPNSKGAVILGAYSRTGLPFGISIRAKCPKYVGIASYCRVIKREKTQIGSKAGFADHVFEIAMTDYIGVTGV